MVDTPLHPPGTCIYPGLEILACSGTVCTSTNCPSDIEQKIPRFFADLISFQAAPLIPLQGLTGVIHSACSPLRSPLFPVAVNSRPFWISALKGNPSSKNRGTTRYPWVSFQRRSPGRPCETTGRCFQKEVWHRSRRDKEAIPAAGRELASRCVFASLRCILPFIKLSQRLCLPPQWPWGKQRHSCFCGVAIFNTNHSKRRTTEKTNSEVSFFLGPPDRLEMGTLFCPNSSRLWGLSPNSLRGGPGRP